MNSLSSMKDSIRLIDLSDELILMIMNKVKPKVLLLCSIISIDNNHLEKLALDKCNSIDLTFDYFQSPYELLLQRFYSYVMPYMINNIQSLSLNIQHIPNIASFIERNCNGTLPNLTHLKIMMGRQHSRTGTPYTLSDNLYGILRRAPLFSNIPQFVVINKSNPALILSKFLCSSVMHSIVSFELDEDCILFNILNDNGLFFRKSIHLTHIRITLFQFEHCIFLLKQVSSQLCSLAVNIMFVRLPNVDILSEIKSISCPNLKQLTIISYGTIIDYENFFIPVLQRLSNVEYLTLLLSIGFEEIRLHHFIDGFDLDKDSISYMSYLQIDTIRQSFMKYQSIDCAIDYFNNNYGQCQIYSLPLIGTRLDFISNRFLLFDINKTFSMVTKLLLFDDIQPFESDFFECVSRPLPPLRTLDIINELEQQEKIKMMRNNLEFSHLSTLILFDIHLDYAKQLLCRTQLPCLVELAIDNNILLTIIAQNQQQAKDKCSREESLRTSEPFYHSINILRNFSPSNSYVKHPDEYKIINK